MARLLARAALLGWLAVILFITLAPHNNRTQRAGESAVQRADRHIDVPGRVPASLRGNETDIVGNVLLFLPLGALALWAFPPPRLEVALAGPVLSVGVETTQHIFLPHRTSSLRDVVTNSTGHVIGVLLALGVAGGVAALRRWRAPGGL